MAISKVSVPPQTLPPQKTSPASPPPSPTALPPAEVSRGWVAAAVAGRVARAAIPSHVPAANNAAMGVTKGVAKPYGLTQLPGAGDWNFEGAVREFQKREHIPSRVRSAMDNATEAQLRAGVSKSWTQDVVQGGKSEKMTVELTKKLIDVPYETFISRVPPDQWGGPNLARYLGGDVKPLAYDAQGRPTRQLERMVLAQDDLAPLLGPYARKLAGKFANDMTKAETISYGQDHARVDWRVYGSDNGSTLADVGSVTFEKQGTGTLVTFHSAHKLGVPGSHLLGKPIPIAPELVGKPLSGAFLAHANHYEQLVAGR